MMEIKQLFCGCLGRTTTSEKNQTGQPETTHHGRLYRLIKKLPVPAELKAALKNRFEHQRKVDPPQGTFRKIETLFNNERHASKKDPDFLHQIRDNLLCSLYHSRMNEFGKHLALSGQRFSPAYLHDIGAVMRPHVKGSVKNGIFTPAGGASNMLTNQAFHILRDANREAAQWASIKLTGHTAHPIARLSEEDNAMLHHQAAHISDQIILSWFSDDTAKIYLDINNELARIANKHMPQATPGDNAPLRARLRARG